VERQLDTRSGDKPAKLADVARAAGVSQGTASNVFNHPKLVRDEVREHVQAVAAQLGYSGPDPRGRMLRAGRVNAIGIATTAPLSYYFEDPFARTLMQGMSEACDAAGAGLSLVSAMNTEKLAWNIDSALVDGFVLLCIEGGDRLVELTKARQLPFVALHLGDPDPGISAIGIDNVVGSALAARHLLELGHRRFAVLSTELTDGHVGWVGKSEIDRAIYTTTRDRLTGLFEAQRAAGLDPALTPIWETENEPKSVVAGLEAIFARPERPTALVCHSDRIALIALDWLARHGISVPHDISVVGFDGVPEGGTSVPPLTTISQPIAEMGRRAVRMILAGGGKAGERETLPVQLTVRGSTASPRG